MDIFTVLFYQPIFNLMVVLYRLFSENLGLAIITIALLSRLITLPITVRQMNMAKTSGEMNEKVKEIKKKFKNDKEKQQQEIMKIQSEYLPSQLSGCLPLILQFIFFINVYNVINNLIAQGAESFNQIAYSFVPVFDTGYNLQTTFLGFIDLKSHASAFQWENLSILPYVVLIVLVGITQFLSIRIMSPQLIAKPEEKSKKEKKDDDKPEDFSAILQQSSKQTMLLFPVMVALISFNVAAGLSLYWIAQNSFVIIQQFVTKRLKKLKNKEVVI